jgi:hypothetical protein
MAATRRRQAQITAFEAGLLRRPTRYDFASYVPLRQVPGTAWSLLLDSLTDSTMGIARKDRELPCPFVRRIVCCWPLLRRC